MHTVCNNPNRRRERKGGEKERHKETELPIIDYIVFDKICSKSVQLRHWVSLKHSSELQLYTANYIDRISDTVVNDLNQLFTLLTMRLQLLYI